MKKKLEELDAVLTKYKGLIRGVELGECVAGNTMIEEDGEDFDTFMKKLKFTPEWLSPHYSITTEELVKKCREKGIKIVPWTVDTPEDIKRMIDLKVDAIISNYPDRVLQQTRGYLVP